MNLVIVDVETTGLSPNTDRVIELGVIQVVDGEVVDRFQQLINPQRSLPRFIQSHTGITSKMVKEAPTFAEAFDKIRPVLDSGIFIAHNVDFDYGFIQAEYRRLGVDFSTPRLCTVQLSRHFFPGYRHHGLDQIIRRFSLDCPSRHRALDDAEVVWQFYRLLQQQFSLDSLVS